MYKGLTRSPATIIVLTIITCGIYGLYWMYTVGTEINTALGKEAVKPVYVLLGIICFPFLWVYMYQVDNAMVELSEVRGTRYSNNFIIWIILSLVFGVGNYIMEIQIQGALNDVWQNS